MTAENSDNQSLCVVHLSDFHFRDTAPDDLNMRAKDIASSVVNKCKAHHVLILITGDISNSGQLDEYVVAEQFFDLIKTELEAKSEFVVHLMVVPGNHDIDTPVESSIVYGPDQYTRELNKMDAFFLFSEGYECGLGNRETEVKEIDIDGFRYTICLINSAPLSTIAGDDKGYHCLSQSARDALMSLPSDGFHILAMHHGLEWFKDDDRLALERLMSNKIDVVFLGHEHKGETRVVRSIDDGLCYLIRGGVYSFCDGNAFFRVINITPQSNQGYGIEQVSCQWNANSQLHVSPERQFNENGILKLGKACAPLPAFIESISKDELGENLALLDVFVFPSLRREVAPDSEDGELVFSQQSDVSDFDSFFRCIEANPCIEVRGGARSGKSFFLKAIYQESAYRGYSPLLLTSDNSTASITRTIKSVIGDQYGDSPVDAERYSRVNKNRKLLLIDDFSSIRWKNKKADVLHSAMLQFGHVIVVCDNVGDITLNEKIEMEFASYSMLPWTKVKRDELVAIRCKASGFSPVQIDNMIMSIDHSVHSHQNLFEMTPPFINQYIDFYLNDPSGKFNQEQLPFTLIYSKNVQRRLFLSLGSECDVDDVLAVLKTIAFELHQSRKSSMSAIELSRLIENYSLEFDNPINPKKVMDAACRSGVLFLVDSGCEYRFVNRSLHAFFVAQAIDLKLDRNFNDGWKHVLRLIDELDYSINEEILLFLGKTRAIPRLTLELSKRARKTVGDGKALSFLNCPAHASLQGIEGLKVEPPSAGSSKVVARVADTMEQRDCEEMERISYDGIYDYSIPDEKTKIDTAISALNYGRVAARCFSGQQTILNAEEKNKVRSDIRDSTGIALNLMLDAFDEDYHGVVEDLIESSTDEIDGAELVKQCQKLVSSLIMGCCIGTLNGVTCNLALPRVVEAYQRDDSGDFNSLFSLSLLLSKDDDVSFTRKAKNIKNVADERSSWSLKVAACLLSGLYIINHPHMSSSAMDSLINGVFDGSKKARIHFFKQTSELALNHK